jgi:hypothetical protein
MENVLNDAVNELRNEAIHLAFLAFVGGVGLVTTVIGWFIRRDIRMAEAARDEQRRATEKADAERGLKHTALEERFNDHVRRTGFELNDVKYRVGIMATEIKATIPEVTIPEWPSR